MLLDGSSSDQEPTALLGFVLSPGITPALVSAVSIELPLSFGLAFVVQGARGLEFAVLLNTFALSVVKVVTDYSDPYDMAVTAGALLAGLAMTGLVLRPGRPGRRGSRAGAMVAGLSGIALGAFKILTDPLDPFDTFLSACAIISGGYVLRRLFDRSARSPGISDPRPG